MFSIINKLKGKLYNYFIDRKDKSLYLIDNHCSDSRYDIFCILMELFYLLSLLVITNRLCKDKILINKVFL